MRYERWGKPAPSPYFCSTPSRVSRRRYGRLLSFAVRLDMEGLPPTEQIIAAIVATGAVLGHCFSPWLRFKGGKGVATSFGAIFAISWPAGLVAVGGWIVGAALTRYSSVGSMLGSVLAPFAIWFFTGSLPETLYGVFSASPNPFDAPRKYSSAYAPEPKARFAFRDGARNPA